MWIHGLVSLPPASMTSTLVAGSSDSRLASTQPAEPAPTMTKSYSASNCMVIPQAFTHPPPRTAGDLIVLGHRCAVNADPAPMLAARGQKMTAGSTRSVSWLAGTSLDKPGHDRLG